MSRMAAPVGEVTMPMWRGNRGRGRLRAVSNRPSRFSFSFSFSKASCRLPWPAASSFCTIN